MTIDERPTAHEDAEEVIGAKPPHERRRCQVRKGVGERVGAPQSLPGFLVLTALARSPKGKPKPYAAPNPKGTGTAISAAVSPADSAPGQRPLHR